jgi:hypothetical protein
MPVQKKSAQPNAAPVVTSGPGFAILSPVAGDTVPLVFSVVGTFPTNGSSISVSISPTGDASSAVVSGNTWTAAFSPAQAASGATITATGPDPDSPQSVTNVTIGTAPGAVFDTVD